MSLRDKVENWALSLLDRAMDSGASMADVTYSDSITRNISLRDGEIETSNSSQADGIGLRVVDRHGRQGMASSNVIDDGSMEQLVQWSLDNCGLSEPEEYVDMAERSEFPEDGLDLWDDSVMHISAEDRLERCLIMHRQASSMDDRVISVRSASCSDGYGYLYYANSKGVSCWHRGTVVSAGVSLVAEDSGAMEIGGFGIQKRHLEDVDFIAVSRTAVSDTLSSLGGIPLPTGRYDLVLSPDAASSLLDVMADMFFASSVQKGRSLFKGKLGEMVASPSLSLVDDGRIPRGMGSAPCDGEGVGCGRTVLLEKGRLEGFLHCLQSAKREGVVSTGNGFRGIGSLPDVDVTNLFFQPGEASPEKLVSSVAKGLLVLDFLGLHTVNPITGEFSLGARGRAINGGKVAGPVKGVTVAGNLTDFLSGVSDVGSDLTFFGEIGSPSLVVRDVVLAGS